MSSGKAFFFFRFPKKFPQIDISPKITIWNYRLNTRFNGGLGKTEIRLFRCLFYVYVCVQSVYSIFNVPHTLEREIVSVHGNHSVTTELPLYVEVIRVGRSLVVGTERKRSETSDTEGSCESLNVRETSLRSP